MTMTTSSNWKTMTNQASVEIFDSIDAYVDNAASIRQGPHVFMLPRWMQAWRQAFTPDDELSIYLIRTNEELIGVAPLSITDATASFVGDPEICDYLDFTVAPGYETEFYTALLDDLSKRRVTQLDLRCLRPESTALSHLVEIARERSATCSVEPDGVSLEMDLPGDWNKYLYILNRQQRHEVRRKLRRLREKGEVHFLALQDAGDIAEYLDTFLRMFRESRPDKEAFMNPRMESFFRSMIRAMSEEGIIRLFVLELNDSPAAAALCFDYEDTMYLYNSGYDPRYSSLSVGLICKILSIKHSIGNGRKKYDFLKGAELYKHNLGGREVPLSRCRIALK
jgi:CelD/BcsL family acetyltransferase involved in cellulose biosynthesis